MSFPAAATLRPNFWSCMNAMERTPDSTDMSPWPGSLSSPHISASHTAATSIGPEDNDELSEDNSELDGNDLEPIAICGFSIKFPQDAISPEAFWKMMCEGRCAMTEFPQSRMNKDGFYRKQNAQNTVSCIYSMS